MKTKALVPPPTTSPLGRREPGNGKLVCWPYEVTTERPATGGIPHAPDRTGRPRWKIPTPYGKDARGRPLWKFVLRYGGKAVVIPARDWEHAHNESMKTLGKWDEVVADKDAKREKRAQAQTGIVSTAGWRWSDLKREWLTFKRGEEHARPSTIDGYEAVIRRHLDPYFIVKLNDPPLVEVTRHAITACKRWFERTGSGTQWNTLATMLYTLFDFAVEDEAISTNPVRRKRHRNRRRVAAVEGATVATTIIPAGHLDAALAEADKHEDPRVAVAVLLTGFGGLRLDELVHARVKDVTVRDDLVDVRVATGIPCARCDTCKKDGGQFSKNDTERWVPFLPEHGRRLVAHLDLLKTYGLDQPDTWLLATLHTRERSKARAGDMIRRDTIAAQVETVVARALGMAPVQVVTKAGKASERHRLPRGERVHVLRKAARTRFSHLGLPSETIDLVMGHTLAGMRATYTHQDRIVTYEMLCIKAGARTGGPRLVKSA